MKKYIGYIELAVVILLVVIVVRIWTYEKPKTDKIPNPTSISEKIVL